jgi:PAS domain S-box-containing protein
MSVGGPSGPGLVDQLRSVLDAAGLGVFDYDVADATVLVDRLTRAAFGLEEERDVFAAEEMLDAIHPHDRPVVEKALAAAARDLGTYSLEHRVCPPAGERWLDVHGKAVIHADGGVHILGTVRDFTDLRSARDEVARVLEHADEAFLALDPSGNVTYVNARAEALLGKPRESLLGRVLWQDFPALFGARFDELARSMRSGSDAVVFEDYSPSLELWVELRSNPGPTGISVYLTDVTTRRARRERNRRLREVAAALARALTPMDVAEVVLEHAMRGVAADSVGVLLTDEERRELRLFAGLTELSDRLRKRWSRLPLTASTPLNEALDTGVPQLIAAREVIRRFPHLSRDVLEVGASYYALLPLATSGPPLGLLALAWMERSSLDDDEMAFLTAITAQCAQALERAQLYEQQRRIAESLQRSLLPQQLPEIANIDLGARYLAGAAGLQVGGDWYDVIPLRDGRVAIAVGDVVGKGLPAATAMGQVRYALRAYAALDPAPASVLSSLDEFFAFRNDEELVTLVYGVLDPADGVFVWANAGHPPPLLIGADIPRAVSAPADGTPLGVPTTRHESTLQLTSGELLLLYSDGLVESRDRPVGEGVEALLQIASRGHWGTTPADQITGDVLNLMLGSRDAEDDATLLAVRWQGPLDDEASQAGPVRADQNRSLVASTKLRPEALAGSSARHFIRPLLEQWRLHDLADVAELCVSELVTNAVLHARTPIQLEVRAGHGVLHVNVRDSGGTRIDLPPREKPGDSLETGRGLYIVQALTARTGVVPSREGMSVWFELDLPADDHEAGDRAGHADFG